MNKNYKVAIASDHAGYGMKEFLIGYLESLDFSVLDLGCESESSVDYPDYGHKLAAALETGEAELGVAICGSANGISMTVNKHARLRAAICWIPEIATLARSHNDANVCSIPARFVSNEEAAAIVDAFFGAEFEGGRHARRVAKI